MMDTDVDALSKRWKTFQVNWLRARRTTRQSGQSSAYHGLCRVVGRRTAPSPIVRMFGLLAFVAAFLGTFGPATAADRPSTNSGGPASIAVGNDVGDRAPEFQLTAIDGQVVLYDTGKPKVIFFMASWCLTCVPEEQALARLYRKYGNEIDIISVDVDVRNDSPEDLRNFQERFGMDWPHVLNVEMAFLFRIRSLDSTFILDRHNVITYRDGWPTDFETLEREILKILVTG